jgi:hypothetical protein
LQEISEGDDESHLEYLFPSFPWKNKHTNTEKHNRSLKVAGWRPVFMAHPIHTNTEEKK